MRNRLERVVRILKLLSTGVPYNPMQLAQESGANRRTIFRDIAALRTLGVPILFDEVACIYSIAKIRGGNEWLLELIENRRTIDASGVIRLHNMTTPDSCRIFAEQLFGMLPEDVLQELKRKLFSSDQSEPELVNARLLELAQAIQAAKPINISVRNSREKPKSMRITPKRILYQGTGWQLVGLNSHGAEVCFEVTTESLSEISFSLIPSTPAQTWAPTSVENSRIS